MRFTLSVILIVLSALCAVRAQDSIESRTIKIPAGLSVDGIPPIPTKLLDEIRPYTFSRFAYLQDLSDKNEMLITTELGNSIQAYVVDKPKGMRRQVTFFDEAVNQCLFDPRNKNNLIIQKDQHGDEYYQVYRNDLSTGKTTLLTKGGKTYNYNLQWNKKGDKLYYTSIEPGKSFSSIYFIDPAKPGSNTLVLNTDGPNWTVQDISARDDKLILTAPHGGSNTMNSLWLYDVQSNKKRLLLPSIGKTGSYLNARFNSDLNGIYLITNQQTEFSQLAFYDLKTNQLNVLTNFNWDVRTVALSPDNTQMAFTVNEAGVIKLYIYSILKHAYKEVKNLPVGFIAGLRWSRDGMSLAFQLSNSNSNSDIYVWNSATGKTTAWVLNEMGGIDKSLIPAPQLIKWKSKDGLEISGFLYAAGKKFTGRRPVIINIHGGPVMQSLPLYDNTTNYYTNELGVAVIFPNIRGSAGFGRQFTEMDNGILKENAVADIGALLEWISGRPELDANRIMITGASYGGYMTYRTAIMYNKKIRCAVEEFGFSDMQSYKRSVDTVYKEFFAREFGDASDPEVNEYFNKISPLKNAHKITMPILIVQGKNDPRIPYTESEQMMKAIRSSGGTVWYLLANDEGHGFANPVNQQYLFYVTVSFIKKYLVSDSE